MLTDAQIVAVNRIRLPVRYAFQVSGKTLDLSCIETSSTIIDVALASYRSRGPNHRRFLATASDGRVFVIDCVSSAFDYAEIETAGVIRARSVFVTDGVGEFEEGRFKGDLPALSDAVVLRNAAHQAWRTGINYIAQLESDGPLPERPGLRKPQVGALHAIAAHWSLHREPAVIVMPTGTGKTEVMVAVAVESRGDRILVVVPSDALREQTAEKFREYGLLRRLGVVDSAANPVVGVLKGVPTDDHIESLRVCNIVVTTMAAISRVDEAGQRAFAALFSEIFFDEAHHIQAETWKKFSTYCGHARTLLFTATPFREDGKALPGKIIYNYPLQAAQDEQFFKPIRFLQVFEPDDTMADTAIAAAAVARLREDLSAGYDHLLLARTDTIERAKWLYDRIYSLNYGDLNPVVIHSRSRGRAQTLRGIRNGNHRIIICVDMFGEGFDLPRLKVAALHSVHKSLGITLQFIGRFARSSGEAIGPATFVANTAEDGVPEALEGLYQEDADWNILLSDLSYDAIDPQARLSDLVENLQPLRIDPDPVHISMLTLRPKLSVEVFRVADFRPQDYVKAFRPRQVIHQPYFSRQDGMLVFVVNQKELIDWTDSRDIATDSWDLYIIFHDAERNLLFINSSRKRVAENLASKVSTEPALIKNEEVFRAFTNLRRLVLHSVGLTSLSKNVRYQMFAGLDVRDAIDPALQANKQKSNVTGVGYENGQRISVGCSRKGKIWALSTGTLAEWREWCRHLGTKLSNNETGPDDFLRYTLVPTELQGLLPDEVALLADWPDQLFEAATFKFNVVIDDRSFGFHDCQLDLGEWRGGSNTFTFTLAAGEDVSATYRQTLLAVARDGLKYEIEQIAGSELRIDAFSRRVTAVEFFTASPPMVRLADGSQLSGEILLKPRESLGETFPRESIQSLNWGSTNIRQESRWKNGEYRPQSIQQRFIEYLEEGPYSFIIDDDDSGESADIVAIEETTDTIAVLFWHCKYASGDSPANNVQDLYEVCGQAQKSTKWAWSFPNLVRHIIERETRLLRGRDSRFVRGSLRQLVALRKASRRKFIVFKVGIVQPGMHAAGITNEHLTILGATNNFLLTVTNSPLRVFASP